MPSSQDIHIDQALTNLAIEYKVPGYIADQVFPVVPVKHESDKYYKFQREELKHLEARRQAGAEAAEIEWNPLNDNYSAEEYALKFLLPDRIVNNADSPIQPRMRTTTKLTRHLWLAKEKRVQAIAQNTAVVTNNAAAAAAWSSSSSDPESDVDAGKESIRKTGGIDPNVMVMSAGVARALRRRLKTKTTHLQLSEEIGFTKLPPMLWDLTLVIGGSIENTATRGQAQTISDVWTNSVILAYVEDSPSLQALSFGYQMTAQQMMTKTWREERRNGEYIEVNHIQAEKAVAADAAYLITGC